MKLAGQWRWALVGLVGLVIAGFFEPVLFQGQLFYSGDTARLYLPAQAALQRALREGRLPWWTPELGLGYPLVAEGEVAALYPFTLALSYWLAPEIAITAQILLHYALMLWGAWLFGRRLGLGRATAAVTALVWALGGFNLAHLGHVSILRVAAWLPWTLWALQRLEPGTPWRQALGRVLALAVMVAMQGLAGHPQMALLNGLAAGLFAVWLVAWERLWRRALQRLGLCLGGAALGLALAAPQLLPTLELVLASQRAGGLDAAFFTSYSFHPLLTGTVVHPFLLGNPYPEGSVELMFYVGLVPLALAVVGLWRSRSRERWWFLAVGVVGWAMALGRWNPVYPWLRLVPVLNLFRVPARYLAWSGLALAYLAGLGIEALGEDAQGRATPVGRRWAAGALALAVGIGAWAATWGDLEHGLAAWRWLPLLLAGSTVAVMAARRAMTFRDWLLLVALAAMVDLYAYQRILLWTYSETAPRATVAAAPEALEMVEGLGGRLYVKEEILPARSVQQEAFYPNVGLGQGVSVLNVYLPLVPSTYEAWLENLGPRDLSLAGATGYVIPQLLPVDAESELYDVRNHLAALTYEQWLDVEPIRARSVEVVSYLSHAAGLADGTLAGRILLRDANGTVVELPLRVGLETAEWAYDRDDVLEQIAHARAPIAESFQARSGFPPREHEGHTYLATWEQPEEMLVTAVRIETELPEAHVRIEEVRLIDAEGAISLLSHALGLGDHRIVYRSEDAVVYQNLDAFARAWWVAAEQVQETAEGLVLDGSVTADAVVPAMVERDGGEAVDVRVVAPTGGYLVLSDLCYPGWSAHLDGEEAPLLCLEGVFRAVEVPAGEHRVQFRYHPLAGLLSRLWSALADESARTP
jgi:hypothetical protein